MKKSASLIATNSDPPIRPPLIPNKCKTGVFKQTFFNRIYNSWNEIPSDHRNVHVIFFNLNQAGLSDYYLTTH